VSFLLEEAVNPESAKDSVRYQAERITTSDSKESPNPICKKTEVPVPKTGKSDYFIASDHPRRSMASEFFTDD